MGIEKHDIVGCTTVAIKLKRGYEYVQNVKAGILHIGNQYDMRTVKRTIHVSRFKKIGQTSIGKYECIMMSVSKIIDTEQCTHTSRNCSKLYRLRMGVKPATF